MSTVRKIILVICIIVFLGSAGVLLDYFIKGMKEDSALKDLSDLKIEKEDLVTEKGTVVGQYVDLYLANQDIIGWIKIDGTGVDYPVMQTQSENEYYIHRDFNRESSSSGTPFMDASSDIFIPTSNFLIYGHNMKNGTMFHDILKYDNEAFYEKHRTFRFDTIYKGGQGTYEVIAAGYSEIYPENSQNFKYYQYADLTSKEEFYEYVQGVKSLTPYEIEATAEYGDQLVTLSTCAYHTDNGRFFIVGKRVDDKQVVPY